MSKIRKKNIVSQANSLIEARYTITKNEQLLLFAMISLINPDDEKFLTFSVEIDQIIEILGLDKKSGLREFEKIAHRLMSRVIKINTSTGWELFHWVSSVKLKNHLISLKFHDDLKPYLLELKKSGNFTQQRLGMAIHFHSIYTIRIYQLLKEYKSKKIYYFEFSLKEFRKMVLGDKDKAYPLYKNFRNKVIDRAKRELGNKDKKTNLYISDLNFELETRRTGRFISHLKFFIVTQKTTSEKVSKNNIPRDKTPRLKTPIKSSKPALEKKNFLNSSQRDPKTIRKSTPAIQALSRHNIKEHLAATFETDQGEAAVLNCVKLYEEKLSQGKIKDLSGGYLISMLEAKAGIKSQAEIEREQNKEKEQRIKREKEQEQRLADYKNKVIVHFEREIKKQFLSQLNQAQKEILWAEIKSQIKYAIPSVLIKKGEELKSPVVGSELSKHIPNYEERKTNYINLKMAQKRQELFGNVDDF